MFPASPNIRIMENIVYIVLPCPSPLIVIQSESLELYSEHCSSVVIVYNMARTSVYTYSTDDGGHMTWMVGLLGQALSERGSCS